MPNSKKINVFTEHLLVFSLYIRIDIESCKEKMVTFFKNLPPEMQRRDDSKKIEEWFTDIHHPQKNSREHIFNFFKEIIDEDESLRNFLWKKEWLNTPLEVLKSERGVPAQLVRAIEKIQEPYAIARSFKAYEKKDLFKKISSEYGHKDYFIYRIHTTADGKLNSQGKLVRDYLRIGGNDGQVIFCNLYQYTTNSKGLDIENIIMFQGNVFFNSNNLLINLSSVKIWEHGLQYGTIMVPRFDSKTERTGVLMATADTTDQPAVVAILIRERAFETTLIEDNGKEITRENMSNYVGEVNLKDFSGYDGIMNNVSDYDEIMKKLDGKGFVISQK